MKLLAAAISFGVLCSANVFAEAKKAEPVKKQGLAQQYSGQGYGMAGCGLGSIIFGDDEGFVQIVASTFNSTWGNQTFGITSGTSNCVDEESGRRAELFIDANRESLEKDISRGQGESLASFSEIVGCPSGLLGSKLQGAYGEIFPVVGADTKSIKKSIIKTISNDEELSQSCSVIIG